MVLWGGIRYAIRQEGGWRWLWGLVTLLVAAGCASIGLVVSLVLFLAAGCQPD
jgi:hypothetical protein